MSERNLALVTGASGGIGLELARLLAEKGFNLVLLARSRNKLEELARELETAHGIQAAVVAADLSEPDAPQAVFDELLQKAIQVDLLVNNAGLMIEAAFKKTSLHDHLQLLQVNVLALTALTRLFIEPMLARNSGQILNVASIASFMPVPNLAVYAASKAYVLSFSEALSEEIKGSKVTVTMSWGHGYCHGPWYRPWRLASLYDHGCQNGRPRRIQSLHGGQDRPCRRDPQRACRAVGEVSAQLAGASGRWSSRQKSRHIGKIRHRNLRDA